MRSDRPFPALPATPVFEVLGKGSGKGETSRLAFPREGASIKGGKAREGLGKGSGKGRPFRPSRPPLGAGGKGNGKGRRK